MRSRRVLLCLPELASEDALTLAREVRAALGGRYDVRLRLADEEDFDEDTTPVEAPTHQPLILRIEDPSDDGERTM